MAQTRFRGLPRKGWMFTFKATAYNVVRLPGLLATGSVCPNYASRPDMRAFGHRLSPSDCCSTISLL
jgi:hypothetical protein